MPARFVPLLPAVPLLAAPAHGQDTADGPTGRAGMGAALATDPPSPPPFTGGVFGPGGRGADTRPGTRPDRQPPT